LKAAFPLFFSIVRCKEASVVDHMLFSNDIFKWNITFIKSVHDWEVEMVTLFFNLLYCIRLSQGGEDRSCWILSKKQTF
jgi:hypothetical protein